MSEVKVNVGQANGQYFLDVKKGKQQAQIPIPDCKSKEDAEIVKSALLKQIEAVEQQQKESAAKGINLTQGTPPEGAAQKLDAAA